MSIVKYGSGMAKEPEAFAQFSANKMAELQLKLIAVNPNQSDRLKLIDEFLTLWDNERKINGLQL